jgi:hypothetical protein
LCGYQICGIERKISNLLHTDGLKLIGRSEEEQTNKIQFVKTIIDDIKYEIWTGEMCQKFV